MIVRKIKFNELKKGDSFVCDGELMVKTLPIFYGPEGFYSNCVSIETGTLYKIADNAEVIHGDFRRNIYGSSVNAEDVCLNDGFVYIITRENGFLSLTDVECYTVTAEYDEPVYLADIQEQHPDAVMVIFENALHGDIYRFGNWEEGKWYHAGVTCGYC